MSSVACWFDGSGAVIINAFFSYFFQPLLGFHNINNLSYLWVLQFMENFVLPLYLLCLIVFQCLSTCYIVGSFLVFKSTVSISSFAHLIAPAAYLLWLEFYFFHWADISRWYNALNEVLIGADGLIVREPLVIVCLLACAFWIFLEWIAILSHFESKKGKGIISIIRGSGYFWFVIICNFVLQDLSCSLVKLRYCSLPCLLIVIAIWLWDMICS